MNLRLLTAFVVLAASVAASAQTRAVFSGVVGECGGEPLAGAMVRIGAGGKVRGFATSREGGRYSVTLTLAEPLDSVDMTVQCMGYEKVSVRLPFGDLVHDVCMRPTSVGLREVTVSAAKINVQGDTLAYNLGAFLGKDDITLEDGLKKLPGVDVEESGKIKYQGRPISNFYVEGMDLLGGKYNQATRSMPADYVSKIEIIDNHQAAKIDKGRQSDNVALNVKLKSDVKFKPMGTTEAAAGYSDRVLYYLSASGMMFTPSFQTILSLKGGNMAEFSADEMADLIVRYGRADVGAPAADYLGNLSSSTPPLKSSRYVSPLDGLATVNAMKKRGDDITIKANAGYSYSRSDYAYTESASYFAGDGNVTISEANSPHSATHKPEIELSVRRNSDALFCENVLRAKAEFLSRDMPVLSDGRAISQSMEKKNFTIADDFGWRIRRGQLYWNFGAGIGYNDAPTLTLMVRQGEEAARVQEMWGNQLRARASASTSYSWSRSRFDVGLSGTYRRDGVHSSQELPGAINNLRGNSGEVELTPRYEYTSAAKRFELGVGLNIALVLLHARNKATQAAIDFDRVYFNPNLRLKYNFNASMSLAWHASLTHDTGDALELMTAPVMTSWLTSRVASGVMMRSRNFSTNLRFDFRKPLDFWWVSATVRFADRLNNLLTSQDVSDDAIAGGSLAGDNSSRSAGGGLSVTKQVPAVRGKFSVNADYGWSSGEMMQQGRVVGYYGQMVSVGPTIFRQDFLTEYSMHNNSVC